MLQDVVESNPPLTEERLRQFEMGHFLHLPKAYRSFLLRYNGGRPVPGAFPIDGFEEDDCGIIQVFFGIDASRETSDLDWFLTDLHQLVPPGILPIATTDGADDLVLDLRRSDCPVMFWDRRPFWGTDRWSEADLYPVARDFETLLSSLSDESFGDAGP